MWTWTQGTGGPATEFKMKCGVASREYSVGKNVPGSESRELLVDMILKNSGLYYCAVVAINGTDPNNKLESAPSEEVIVRFTQAAPAAPTGLQVIEQ